jgi:hypothetical protein
MRCSRRLPFSAQARAQRTQRPAARPAIRAPNRPEATHVRNYPRVLLRWASLRAGMLMNEPPCRCGAGPAWRRCGRPPAGRSLPAGGMSRLCRHQQASWLHPVCICAAPCVVGDCQAYRLPLWGGAVRALRWVQWVRERQQLAAAAAAAAPLAAAGVSVQAALCPAEWAPPGSAQCRSGAVAERGAQGRQRGESEAVVKPRALPLVCATGCRRRRRCLALGPPAAAAVRRPCLLPVSLSVPVLAASLGYCFKLSR